MKTSEKFKMFLLGVLALPCVVGLIVVLTWVRKFMTDFWAALFF